MKRLEFEHVQSVSERARGKPIAWHGEARSWMSKGEGGSIAIDGTEKKGCRLLKRSMAI